MGYFTSTSYLEGGTLIVHWILCSEEKCNADPFSRADPVNAITARLAEILASRYPDLGYPGWPGCHVIMKLIFVAFNRRAEISANRASPANQNSLTRVIRA